MEYENNITGSEAIERMRRINLVPGANFGIKFITCDLNRPEKSGRVDFYADCVKIDINGVVSKHLIGKIIAPTDQFGNERYMLQFSDVSGEPSNYNGAVNRLFRNQALGDFSVSLTDDETSSNLILKDYVYISGQACSNLNN